MDGQLLDQLGTFLQDRWFVIVGAVIVLLIIINVVKTVLKWVLVLALVAGVYFYGADYIGNIKDIGALKNLGAEVASTLKTEALKAMAGEAADATYQSGGDGTFTITTKNLELKGQAGSDEVNVSFRGQSLGKVKIDDTVRVFIETSKKNIS
ncbi:hypothetical protein [Paenibacillus gansuensis]|uniref:Uncharacterized protein n=1 Tax=Paenibacillus gansuensis TaxID=306542 RepID=A0ABW5PGW0_9BACL